MNQVEEDQFDTDGPMPFRTALWMVLAMSLLMGVGAAAFDSHRLLAFLGWTLVSLIILGVAVSLVAVVARAVQTVEKRSRERPAANLKPPRAPHIFALPIC